MKQMTSVKIMEGQVILNFGKVKDYTEVRCMPKMRTSDNVNIVILQFGG